MIMVYVTYPSLEKAREVSAAVLEARLAACANIMPAHQALYWWEGKIEEAQEVTVLYKTRPALMEALNAFILKAHPYECPCVVSWPLEAGNPEFMRWIERETQKG